MKAATAEKLQPGADYVLRLQEAARTLIRDGAAVVAVPFGEKGPNQRGWQRSGITDEGRAEDVFIQAQNLGVLLGRPSRGWVDADCDWPEAATIASYLMPQTPRRHGRPGNPGSHLHYRLPATEWSTKTEKWRDPTIADKKKATIIELRATGGQTILPPSWHPDGEEYAWEEFGEMPVVPLVTLRPAFCRVAAASLLARYWPNGARHEAALALAGTLLRAGWSREDAELLIRAVCHGSGDEEPHDRIRAVADTQKKLEADSRATGARTLADLLGGQGQIIVRRVAEWLELKGSWEEEPPKLRALDLAEMLSLQIPPREMLLTPWSPSAGLAMIFGPRGIAKTYFVMNAGYAVATGCQFLRFKAPEPRRVLLIDGEMPAATMQQRLIDIVEAGDVQPPSPDYFRTITPDAQECPLPDLASATGQSAIEPFLDGVALVIIDNLSSLCRSGVENEAESWLPVQSWALRLRRRGISVWFVHHAGKGGAQRGTSRREDVLDTVISLKWPKDYKPTEGCRFEWHLEKGRSVHGDGAEPFEAQLGTDEQGRMIWTVRSIEDRTLEQVVELANEGMNQRDIAGELGISKSKVNRLVAKAREEGKIR